MGHGLHKTLRVQDWEKKPHPRDTWGLLPFFSEACFLELGMILNCEMAPAPPNSEI